MTCALCHDSKRVTALHPAPSGNPKHRPVSVIAPCPRCQKRERAWMEAMERFDAQNRERVGMRS